MRRVPRSADRVGARSARLLPGYLAHDRLGLGDRRRGSRIAEVERHRVDDRRVDRDNTRLAVADTVEPVELGERVLLLDRLDRFVEQVEADLVARERSLERQEAAPVEWREPERRIASRCSRVA